ncbi:hypothetical protein FNV43_RR20300 [Rhamnella rubrinervis]|uniref:Uncharacterized protein n=1 Tax=Rhamnella rubrinervis TaxID=2594499 RepID=A0A8K0GU24_9ROSA|nr:hypothetical protein FNV43_RR20300 [Rhamnella rubrinervis]
MGYGDVGWRNEVIHYGKRSMVGYAQMLSEKIVEFTSVRDIGGLKNVIVGHTEGAFCIALRDEQVRVLFLISKLSHTSNVAKAKLKTLV